MKALSLVSMIMASELVERIKNESLINYIVFQQATYIMLKDLGLA